MTSSPSLKRWMVRDVIGQNSPPRSRDEGVDDRDHFFFFFFFCFFYLDHPEEPIPSLNLARLGRDRCPSSTARRRRWQIPRRPITEAIGFRSLQVQSRRMAAGLEDRLRQNSDDVPRAEPPDGFDRGKIVKVDRVRVEGIRRRDGGAWRSARARRISGLADQRRAADARHTGRRRRQAGAAAISASCASQPFPPSTTRGAAGARLCTSTRAISWPPPMAIRNGGRSASAYSSAARLRHEIGLRGAICKQSRPANHSSPRPLQVEAHLQSPPTSSAIGVMARVAGRDAGRRSSSRSLQVMAWATSCSAR